jgi:hypothetical protein
MNDLISINGLRIVKIKAETTALNRSVYAAPAVAGLASIRLGRLRLPRLIPAHLGGTQTYGLLYCAAQTS